MQINISRLRPITIRVFRLTLFASLTAFLVAGVIVAGAFTANRDFDGSISVDICRKNAEGRWEVVDNVKAPLRFSASAVDLATGKSVGTDFVWRARTAKGVSFAGRLERAGNASFDLRTGQLDLQSLPFVVEVGGKSERVPLTLTTESLSSPNGPINGKRAVINGRTAQLSVVGVGAVSSEITGIRDGSSNATDKSASRKSEKAEQLALVFRVDGRLTAK